MSFGPLLDFLWPAVHSGVSVGWDYGGGYTTYVKSVLHSKGEGSIMLRVVVLNH